MSTLPNYLYKYHSVNNFKELDKCPIIKSLLEHKCLFSTRKNMNDIFDTRIKTKRPSVKEVKGIARQYSHYPKKTGKLTNKGYFTDEGLKMLNLGEEFIHKKIDEKYHFFCLSATVESNLMWSHYADSHKGFCIKFK